jgi:hypothetical protein
MSGLKDYYELDFTKTFIAKYELSMMIDGTQKDQGFSAQAHIDFSSHVKFCSFYIPIELCNELFEMCKTVLSYTRDVLALRDGGQVTLPRADRASTGQIIQLRSNDEYLDIEFYSQGGQKYSTSNFLTSPPVYQYSPGLVNVLGAIWFAEDSNKVIRSIAKVLDE